MGAPEHEEVSNRSDRGDVFQAERILGRYDVLLRVVTSFDTVAIFLELWPAVAPFTPPKLLIDV